MAHHVGVYATALLGAHMVEVREESGSVDALVRIETKPVKFAFAKSREVERRFAQSLRGESSSVRSCTTGEWFPFDECDFFTEIRGLRRPLLAGRAGANDNEVVVHRSAMQTRPASLARFFN